MDLFSISQLAQFSGIKAHTIRIWEKRYNALEPNRSEGNTRYYDNSQLRRLLNISGLLKSDHKVSKLCAMPDEGLAELVKELHASFDETTEYFISQLIAAGMSYDEPYFVSIFSHCVLRYGMKDAYLKVFYPMLDRIGLIWLSDLRPSAHENYISNMLRQKLFMAVDSLSPAKTTTDGWLLFLPENELHEIGLLFAHYLIRLSEKRSVYLGANVPLPAITAAVGEIRPSSLLLFLVHNDLVDSTQTYLDTIRKNFKDVNIYLAGNQDLISQLKLNKKVIWLKSVEDLEQRLWTTV